MNSRGAVLVCVTGQRDCDRLIKAGKRIAEERSVPLHVLCVQPTSAGFDADCEELEYLRQTSRDVQAEMSVYFHDDAALLAVGFVKQIGATHIVTGMAEAPLMDLWKSFISFCPKSPFPWWQKTASYIISARQTERQCPPE